MSTAIALPEKSGQPLPSVGILEIDASSQNPLGFIKGINEATWLSDVEIASRAINRLQFVLGDLMLCGEKAFGEDAYAKAAAVAGKNPETLRNYAWVSSRVPDFNRNPNLSFYHHRAVARLNMTGQAYWLARADTEELSVLQLKQAILDAKPDKDVCAENCVGVAISRALTIVNKLTATLVDEEQAKFFLAMLIDNLTAKLDELDGVTHVTAPQVGA